MINKLSSKRDKFPPIVDEIVGKMIRQYSYYLTMFLEDSNIARTINWIERIFGDLASSYLNKKHYLDFYRELI